MILVYIILLAALLMYVGALAMFLSALIHITAYWDSHDSIYTPTIPLIETVAKATGCLLLSAALIVVGNYIMIVEVLVWVQ